MSRARQMGAVAVARAAGLALLALLAGVLLWLWCPVAPVAVPDTAQGTDAFSPPGSDTDPTTIERGRYLATLGNCQHCHTPPGAAPYAGGRALPTPFGVVYTSNLTPSAHGLGGWSAGDFWRALHHGQSRDGRWLTPAFPFANTTHVTRADSDALWTYLRSLPAVDAPAPAHRLEWPFNTQAALKVWRALYFTPATPTAHTSNAATSSGSGANPGANAEWARGAYLVQGLGHCGACHAERNALGASPHMAALGGGQLPGQGWYAPSLANPAEGGLQDWSQAQIVELFRTGRSGGAFATGPMAAVVQHSTQHWTDSDLRAMATYLQQLPPTSGTGTRAPAAAVTANTAPTQTLAVSNRPGSRQPEAGAKLYGQHCAQCHGEQGEGSRLADGRFAYPPLAGSRAVNLAQSDNAVQMVLHGGFSVATASQPRPFGMPPYVLALSDTELASVLTHIRGQWGNHAPPVTERDVARLR